MRSPASFLVFEFIYLISWNHWSKWHFSDFESRFFHVFSSMLQKFWVSGARWGRILPESEERIEKYLDTRENESRQKCENFDPFSNKKTKQICFDHNFSKSTAMALRFCTYSALELLSLNICAASAHSTEKLNFRARTFRPPRGRYILE